MPLMGWRGGRERRHDIGTGTRHLSGCQWVVSHIVYVSAIKGNDTKATSKRVKWDKKKERMKTLWKLEVCSDQTEGMLKFIITLEDIWVGEGLPEMEVVWALKRKEKKEEK